MDEEKLPEYKIKCPHCEMEFFIKGLRRITKDELLKEGDKELKDCYGSYKEGDIACEQCEDKTNCFEHQGR